MEGEYNQDGCALLQLEFVIFLIIRLKELKWENTTVCAYSVGFTNTSEINCYK